MVVAQWMVEHWQLRFNFQLEAVPAFPLAHHHIKHNFISNGSLKQCFVVTDNNVVDVPLGLTKY